MPVSAAAGTTLPPRIGDARVGGMGKKILIADPSEITRLGMRQAATLADLSVVGEAATAEEAVRLAGQHHPHVVLIDVPMADGGAWDAIAQLRDSPQPPQVVACSAFDNAGYLAKGMAVGACAYVLKNASLTDLAAILRKAANGESSWSPQQVRRASTAAGKPLRHLDVEAPLTQRELQILIEIASGATNEQIAATLGISYETVKEHVQNVLHKIQVVGRTQAAVWAVRNGLV